MPYRYILEPYKGLRSRYTCPNCGKQRVFTRYIDTLTNTHLHEHVGKCNREIKCSYHYKPKQYFETHKPFSENDIKSRGIYTEKNKGQCSKHPISFIPSNTFDKSLNKYSENNFVFFLLNHFGPEITEKLIHQYFIGTSRYWSGATIFWQVDKLKRVRTGKIMLYDRITGKRSKEPHQTPNWVHAVLKLTEFNLKQCLFGEHLLKESSKPVAICESEKTAIIASAYLPQFNWLACGSLTGLNAEKCKVLKGRKVFLFPDLKALDKWQIKAKELSHLTTFTVSSLLERNATKREKEKGLDLADYLLRFPLKKIKPEPFRIYTADITSIIYEVHTGKEYNQLIILGIKTITGHVYDLLLDELGELIIPDSQFETVNRLAHFYEREFRLLYFNNTLCLAHVYSYQIKSQL